jgi:hypothetical protein
MLWGGIAGPIMHRLSLHVPLLLLWICFTLWFEVALFRLSATTCSFPRDLSSDYAVRATYAVIADPQLTDVGSYERGLSAFWPLQNLIEWSSDSFMRRAYAHAVQTLNADGELFLGDMFDTAAFGSDELFLRSFKRFSYIFPATSFRLFVPGNHDLGLMSAYSSKRRLRYNRHFGASDFEFESTLVPFRFVGINAPAISSGSCSPQPPVTHFLVDLFVIAAAERLLPRAHALSAFRFVSFCNKSSPAPEIDCPQWMAGPRGFADAHADSKLSMAV